jgi:hypothetical protein
VSPEGRRKPDFFVVGHPKCGTTALYEALSAHPLIFLARPKEPHYLATELRYRPEWGEYGELPKDLDEYLSLFGAAEPGQLAGESSAWYLWSQSAAAEIAGLQPDARIVAVIREPAAFLRSLHLQLVQAHVEPEGDLRAALALDRERRDGRVPKIPDSPRDWPQVLPIAGGLVYADYIRYVEQLRRFRERFPPENVLVLIYDDFRADNAGTIERVLRFLGVDEEVELVVAEANPTVRVRSRRMNDLLRSLYMGDGPAARRLKGVIKAVVPSQRLRRRAVESAQHQLLYTAPGSPDEKLTAELKERFAPEVKALSAYLDRDLVSLWGYENAA